ncbi:uncharacterized protein B0I36DRAFT_362092 [Microdochium trichocladiopsis]|uniref:RING-type domain-containing protein n=1 Tax=Microdochium trichocladiopsis TaxID=1682393 RepID=A0A9P8Y9U6_9PEZI|nr:uncharacterized protein B0I36DRAFT_362092 [Microdochium trichocladiopsis]KAH7033425.1 hypothetical protein B0I36DRAFT_362092 [Microdochium trichocladiopsis]
MPGIPGTRTAFPVLRRGRKRTWLRSQDGEDAVNSTTTSRARHSSDKSMHISPVEVQAEAAKCSSSPDRPSASITTTSNAASPATADTTGTEVPAQNQERRRRRLSRRPPALNPLRIRKGAVTPQAPPPAPSPPLEECSICQDPVGVANPEGVTETWAELQCGHRFGRTCIITWIIDSLNRDCYTNPSCPVCRRDIIHPCGHLIVVPLTRVSAAVGDRHSNHENNGGRSETEEDDTGGEGFDTDADDNDETSANVQRHRRRFSMISRVSLQSRVAAVMSTSFLRLVSATIVRAVKLSRRMSLRVRMSRQSLCADESSDAIQVMPPAGHCTICRETRGDEPDDSDGSQEE